MALGENEDSILNSVKLYLPMEPDNTDFDSTLILYINGLFETLHQLGVGPAGFEIKDSTTKWSDYVTDVVNIPLVKTYVGSKVRIQFDPPTNSTLLESLKANSAEAEWRLNMDRDTAYKDYD